MHLDAALALGAKVGATAHAHVAVLAPAFTPRVLHDPVVVATSSAVANNEDTVVKTGSAGSSEDTTAVELEGELVSLDGNGNGLLRDSGHKGVLVVLGHIDVRRDGSNRLAGAGAAAAVLSLIGVSLLRADAVVDDVLEAKVHGATVAALVAVGARAVDELLFRKGDEVAGLDGGDALSGAGGGESPAGAALALVLHAGDGALLAPVNLRGKVRGVHAEVLKSEVLATGASATEAANVTSAELVEGDIGEVVEGKGVRSALGVVVLNKIHVLGGRC